MDNAPKIFLSYADEDNARVREIYRYLKEEGFNPWMAEEDLLPGQYWQHEIRRSLKESDFVILFLSETSVSKRGYFQKEFNDALRIWEEVPESEIFLIPARLEHCEVPNSLNHLQWVDLFKADGLDRLLRALDPGLKRWNTVQDHFMILQKGVETWNRWRNLNPSTEPQLLRKDLSDMNLEGINLSQTNLTMTDLIGSNLSGASLTFANCRRADLRNANLTDADLRNANLNYALLIETNFQNADLSECSIYGISAWDVKLDKTIQHNLQLYREGEPVITVDNIEVAQFIYLLVRNERVRQIIDTITSKVVLILGRFTPDRKAVLDALRTELRKHDYLPILFDFEKPQGRTTDETIGVLARMARFVVADLTDAKSVLQELRGIVPDLPSLPILPLLHESQREPGMFEFFLKYPWVLSTYYYADTSSLIVSLYTSIIEPLEQKVKEREMA